MTGPEKVRPDLDLSLPIGVEASSIARWSLTSALASCDQETRFKVVLLVSELVTNAIQHSDPWVTDTIGVRLFSLATRTRVEVSDPARAEGVVIPPRARRGSDSSGLGLWLLDHLADEWGVDQCGGTTVWFEVVHPSAKLRLSGT